jgi:ABC-type phosphate transport system permease subunit
MIQSTQSEGFAGLKSQDDFEKYINVLASGGLAITIAFFDKIVDIHKSTYIFLIIIGWVLLVTTLLTNLISHYLSISYAQKTIDEINEKKYDDVFTNVKNRNKCINILNRLSIGTLIIGIVSIIMFVTINLTIVKNNHKLMQKPQNTLLLMEERVRTINNPPQSKPNINQKK